MILILNSVNVIKIYTSSVIALTCANNTGSHSQRIIGRHQFTKALLKSDAIRANFDSEDKQEIEYFMMKIMPMIRSSDLGFKSPKDQGYHRSIRCLWQHPTQEPRTSCCCALPSVLKSIASRPSSLTHPKILWACLKSFSKSYFFLSWSEQISAGFNKVLRLTCI